MTLPLSKVIDVDDFEAPELEPYLREIDAEEAVRVGSTVDDGVPDAKRWTYAMLLRALDCAGAASAGRMVAGIGAGTEPTIFALARRGAIVFPADRYLQRTRWSDEAPAGMLVDPSHYSPLDFPAGHVLPVHSSALKLNLPSNAFDAVFGATPFEHLGSLENVAIAAREIARVLKPGGVASLAVEFRVDGPADRRGFDAATLLFTHPAIGKYIVDASGLTLREPIVLEQSDRTFETRRAAIDFPGRAQAAQGLEEKQAASPNLVVYHDGFLFCPVVLTLHKDHPLPQPGTEEAAAWRRAAAQVDEDNAALAADLERRQRLGDATEAPAENHWLFGEIGRLQNEISALHAAYDRSNAWKRWAVMRPARYVYRRVKRWRG